MRGVNVVKWDRWDLGDLGDIACQIPKKRIFILTNETDYYRERAFVDGNRWPFAEFLIPQSAPICVIGRLA
jgi:hypothetical protein